RVHGDAGRGELTRPYPSAGFERGLGGGIWGAFGDAERGQARDVDDAAPFRVDHAGQDRLNHLHRGAHVHVVGGEKITRADGADAAELRVADVVDDRVHGALVDDLLQGGRRRGPIGQVDLVELAREVRRRRPRNPAHVVPAGGQAVGDRAADALGGAGNQN